MVGALGVVKDQPVGQFAVKERKVGKEQLLVVVDEGLWIVRLNRSAWAFKDG
jgi:hypothetical protein